MRVSAGKVVPLRRFLSRGALAPAVAFVLATGCHGQPTAVITQLTEARRLAADLRVQFNKTSEASNRAVMADTDETSVAFAREADRIKGLVRSDVTALGPHLHSLGYASESQALEDFGAHFAEYEALDRKILELAVENTNLKAQRLSFGPAREASDAFRDALAPLTAGAGAGSAASKSHWQIEALIAEAVLAVREIQVLQAPHIAASEDAVMTRLEAQMSALEAKARDHLSTLTGLLDGRARPQAAAAVAALDRFQGVSKEILKLSRRNSNVRSLELSLRQKPTVTGACDESLRVLQDALGKESFAATR